MRIKKPKGQQVEYKIYSDIAERNTASGKMLNGQEVKVLDASDDENIGSGWAIYKYDKQRNLFDLLEKEEQPKGVAVDNETVSLNTYNSGEELKAWASELPIPTNVKILKDFDISLEIDERGKKCSVLVNGSSTKAVSIPFMVGDRKRYLIMKGKTFDQSYVSDHYEETMYFGIFAAIRDDERNMNMPLYVNKYFKAGVEVLGGYPFDVKDMSAEWTFPIAQIQFKNPISKWYWKNYMFKLAKYWKQALAPAEERIEIPEQTEYSEYFGDDHSTHLGVNNRFITPDAMVTNRTDVRILEDFDYTARVAGNFARLEVVGGERTIPVMVGGVKKYMSLSNQSLNYVGFDNGGKGKRVHWALHAYIEDTDTQKWNLGYSTNVNGEPIATKPHNLNNILTIMQVSAQIPVLGGNPKNESFIIHKYWKKALVPAEERIQTGSYNLDKVTLFETRLSEKDSIFAPELCNANPVNIRLLEDFDFTFSTALTFTGSKPYLQCELIGGNRFINVMVDGENKKMSLASEGVVMQDIFNTNYHGKWTFFTLLAVIDDGASGIHPLGTEYENDNGDIMNVTQYANSTQFKLAQIGVKFEADGETLDLKNVRVLKYWKKSLAPFDELMQDYNQRNP